MCGDPSRAITVFVDQVSLDLGIDLPQSAIGLRVCLEPDQMRGLAAELMAAADERECRAGDEATALLARIGKLN